MKLNKWLLSLLLLIITTLSLFAPWGWLKLSLAILNLLTLSIIYGYWQEGKKQILVNLLSGYLLLFSLIVIINALLLFYWEISYLSNLILYLIFVAGALIIIKQKEIVGEINFSWPVNFLHPTKKIVIYLLYWLIICSLIILFTQIFFHRSEQIIFSIWQILPSNFLLFYLLLIISLFVYLTVATTGKNIALMSILFLSSGLGVMIYRLNYGFDPFIHQATESIIWGQGFVTPRPIYYLGYYGIINFFQHFLSLSNVLIDRYITIINYAIILPLTINQWSTIKRYHYWPAAPLFLLLLPLTTIALNTPQALANVLLLITIFLLLADDLRNKNYLLLLLGLTTILIHPLSGIPLIFCLLFYFYHFYVSDKTKKNLLHILSFILLVLSPAILLVINSMLRGEQMRLEFVTSSAQQIFANIVPGFNNFVNNFDFVYLYENWWVILLISYFLIITIKYRSSKYYCYGLTFLGVSCGYLILKTMISFDFLISYEKDNYSNRLWEIGLLFLIPYLIIFWLKVLDKVRKDKFILLFIFTLLAVMITSSLYLSYPRRDQYYYNKLINTSINDFAAVTAIEQHAKNIDYIVLANQSVSAAAIAQYGFAHYYQNNFYYPLPTSGVLYTLYLQLAYNEKDNKAVLSAVQQLTGVNRIYFVINNYWTGYDDIVKQQRNMSSWQKNINDQEYIFSYDLPASSN